MKQAVFFGSEEKIDQVYSEDLRRTLAEEARFLTDHVITVGEMEEYAPVLAEAECLFTTWGMPHLLAESIRNFFPNLKHVYYAAGSVQGFAREFLDAGIAVYSAWEANGIPVADYTFAQIILAAKGFFSRIHDHAHRGTWQNRALRTAYPGVYECTVGIIGAGMIGKMVIERLKMLEKTRILVFDPFLPDAKAVELGVVKTDLEELFRESDVVSNHLANNPDTVGMLHGGLFSQMKPHAVFLNTGRGAQVVEADLVAALREVPTRAAVLDVTMPEPPAADSPFYTMENVWLTPHIAGSLGNEVHRMAEFMFEEYRRVEAGETPRWSVTLEMLKTMA